MALNLEQFVANAGSNIRREVLNGRNYLVAPLTLIVPGVLHGSKGALYYPPEEVRKDYIAWNHTPIVVNHPTSDLGYPLSARDPGVLSKSGIGYVFKARINNQGKLKAEGWFDEQHTQRVSQKVWNMLQKGKPFELSTGLFTDNALAQNGSHYQGKAYTHIARNYRPDHLAILPDKVGACSVKDGCGVLVNQDLDTQELDDAPVNVHNSIVPTSDGRYRLVSRRGRTIGIYDSLFDASQEEWKLDAFQGGPYLNQMTELVSNEMIHNCDCGVCSTCKDHEVNNEDDDEDGMEGVFNMDNEPELVYNYTHNYDASEARDDAGKWTISKLIAGGIKGTAKVGAGAALGYGGTVGGAKLGGKIGFKLGIKHGSIGALLGGLAGTGAGALLGSSVGSHLAGDIGGTPGKLGSTLGSYAGGYKVIKKLKPVGNANPNHDAYGRFASSAQASTKIANHYSKKAEGSNDYKAHAKAAHYHGLAKSDHQEAANAAPNEIMKQRHMDESSIHQQAGWKHLSKVNDLLSNNEQIINFSGPWDESKHPRDKGKFSSGPGSSGGGTATMPNPGAAAASRRSGAVKSDLGRMKRKQATKKAGVGKFAKGLGGAAVGAAGAVGGEWAGAALGAKVGSVAGPWGTAIGAALGGTAGYFAGGEAGSHVAKKVGGHSAAVGAGIARDVVGIASTGRAVYKGVRKAQALGKGFKYKPKGSSYQGAKPKPSGPTYTGDPVKDLHSHVRTKGANADFHSKYSKLNPEQKAKFNRQHSTGTYNALQLLHNQIKAQNNGK